MSLEPKIHFHPLGHGVVSGYREQGSLPQVPGFIDAVC